MNQRLRNSREGFTLVEVLVVLALTTLMMGLLFGPIFSSFKLTQRGQAMGEVQETGRLAMEQMTREIGDAMYIYDTFTERGIYRMTDPGTMPGTTLNVKFESQGGDYSYIDLVLPKNLLSDDASSLTIKEPLEPEERIVRYFIGLEDPTRPYVNKNLVPSASGDNNTYVLYRWEFNPFDQSDPAYDPSVLTKTGADSPTQDWRKPDWFSKVWSSIPANQDPRKVLRLSVVIPGGRYDLVRARIGKDDDGTTSVLLSAGIRFLPLRVSKEALTPMATGDYSRSAPPTSYSATYGNWLGLDSTPETYDSSVKIMAYDGAKTPPTAVTPSLSWNCRKGVVTCAKPVEMEFSAVATPPGATATYEMGGVNVANGESPVPGSIKVRLFYNPVADPARLDYEDYNEVSIYNGSLKPSFSCNLDPATQKYVLTFNNLRPYNSAENQKFKVTCMVQDNQPTDTLYASYVTTSLITVNMGLRKYGPDSQPLGISLTTKVRPRNLCR